MYRTLVLAAALGALALPAAAATAIKIDVTGLDAKAAHAKIYEAAQQACRIELQDASSLVQFYVRADCVRDAVNRADAEWTSLSGRLASR
jgi:hypothetical protein